MEDGLWNTGLSEAFFHSWKTARSSERGFSSKRTLVTLPILLPIKIYWEQPGKHCTASIITTSLSKTNKCNDQKNKKIRGGRGGDASPTFGVHNRDLIYRDDLQYGKSDKIYCDRLNGT